jgi:hypothetical protein
MRHGMTGAENLGRTVPITNLLTGSFVAVIAARSFPGCGPARAPRLRSSPGHRVPPVGTYVPEEEDERCRFGTDEADEELTVVGPRRTDPQPEHGCDERDQQDRGEENEQSTVA